MRRIAVTAACIGLASAAFADGLPDGRGVAAPSGSSFATEIAPAADVDDYVIDGCRGTTLSATVTVSRRSALAPVVEVVRPGGAVVTEAEGLVRRGGPRSPSVRFALDRTGVWKVRVRGGDDGPTGAYSVAVRTSKPGTTRAALDAPDVNGQFRFLVPARGGATVSWTLKRAGGLPSFNSFVDPHGEPVEGLAGGTAVRRFRLPAGAPLGDYALTFDAVAGEGPATLALTVVPPKAKARTGRLSAVEPAIAADGVSPTSGGAGTLLTVKALSLVDPGARRGATVGLHLGDAALEDVRLLADHTTVTGRVPAGLAIGTYDVVVTSTSGQPAVRADAFEVVPPPTLLAVDPPFSTVLGGQEITLTGRDFRASMGLLVDGALQPVTASYADATTLRFTTAPHAAGTVALSVVDLESQLASEATVGFEFVTTPVISHVTPPLVLALGGDAVTLEGLLFAADDKVFLETTTPGTFEEVTATQTTFVDAARHRFVAPVRPKGEYRVYVQDAAGRPDPPRTAALTYFDFADVTADSGLGTAVTDPCDGVTTALFDVDHDGDLDLALARSGGDAAAATPQTRILVNDGHGAFTDATASVMPAAGADDWRADRIVAADLDGDGRTDLVLTTNSLTIPPASRSHTRLLMNERRGGAGGDADARVLRDRTTDLMAPVRTMKRYGRFGGDDSTYVSDDWRGLDVWVGDLDRSGSGPPAIVLTHDEVKDDDNPNADVAASGVYCGAYCSSPYGGLYAYSFYWGGSRAFVWDRNARGGLGRYRFDANFFPRKAGTVVQWSLAPGGIAPPPCSANYNSLCKATFTPFAGKRLAVGDLDADGRPDVAVVADHAVQRRFTVNGPLTTISSLQVARQGFNAQDGAKVTDVTAKLTALGLDLAGDAVAIGATGFPDGGASGTIALARASAAPGLRLVRFFDDAGTLSVADVSGPTLPAAVGADVLQAAEVRFLDVDGDGDQDLVLLAPAAPSGTQAALRILRNDEVNGIRGVFTRPFGAAVEAAVLPADPFDGAALSIGDVSGDGLTEFVVTRSAPGEQSTNTRILSQER